MTAAVKETILLNQRNYGIIPAKMAQNAITIALPTPIGRCCRVACKLTRWYWRSRCGLWPSLVCKSASGHTANL